MIHRKDPECGIRPNVGLRPTTPQRAAGIRTDPNQAEKVAQKLTLISTRRRTF